MSRSREMDLRDPAAFDLRAMADRLALLETEHKAAVALAEHREGCRKCRHDDYANTDYTIQKSTHDCREGARLRTAHTDAVKKAST